MKSATRRIAEVSNIIASLDLSMLPATASLFEAVHRSLSSTAWTEDPGVPLPPVMAGPVLLRGHSEWTVCQSQADVIQVTGCSESGLF